MNRTYKYRLYPNKTQDCQLDFMLWQGRKIYNGALEMFQDHREINGFNVHPYEVRDYWVEQRRQEPETFGLLPSATVDDLIRRLHKAYQNAWKRVERGEFTVRKNGTKNYGFPRFKNRKDFSSLGFIPVKSPITELSNGWARLYLTKLGTIRLRYHRDLPIGVQVKMIIISRDKLGKWWASLQCKFEDSTVEPSNKPAVGVDIGLVYALAMSDGNTIDCPKWYQDGQKKRRVLLRKLDRQRRSNNPGCYNEDGTVIPGKRPLNKSARMRETERQLQSLEASIGQQRWYFWHTITDWLTSEYGMIAIEDLTLDFMLKNKRLAMHAQNAAFGEFWQMLEYKAQERGVEIVRVPPAYTSQTCSECGAVDAGNRKTQANFSCVACGHSENADINAAKNILRAAL